MSNYFLFTALPYAALIIFLVGTIIRYRQTGFQVSSLSSQFLEGKALFWGSQPFHWGLMFLFFGHLIGFLFPSSVIALNGQPVRMMIIEITAFGFGLSVLFGLVMLIIRRFSNERIKMVTSKMDYVVYAILVTQVVSGLWVAYFSRWGSAWFASTLTPYLRSIFVLDPQIDAVAAMPFHVQLHVISAFVMIGIIPFTRFVHFLVYPIQYIWRGYQQVIWNWDRKKIRKSKKMVNGVRSKNN